MRRVAAAFLFALVVIVPARAQSVRDAKLQTKLIVGVVAFNPDQGTDRIRTVDPMLQAYLDSITKVAANAGVDLHFEVVRGNYYQVLRWMRDKSIDAALVSPFTYHVLRADTGANGSRTLLPLAVFRTPGLPTANGVIDGNAPMFRAVREGKPLANPDGILKQCAAMLRKQGSQCRFAFVTHLSTTGFLYPLVRIDQELKEERSSIADVMPRLLEQTRFLLWHKAIPSEETQLQFTYAYGLVKRARGAGEDIESYVEKEGWIPLLPTRVALDEKQGAFADDLLVLSGESSRAIELRKIPEFAEGTSIWRPTGVRPSLRSGEYLAPIPYSEIPHEDLARDVEQVRNMDPKLWDRWYVNEQYEFTLPELVDVLKNDQRLSGREEDAAIVLPGGGVRGAYQAVVLDALYKDHVVNAAAQSKDRNRLVIANIVGTSGGALMGYFAARKPAGMPLTERWIKNNEVTLQPHQVFPITGAMRWFSVLVAVAVLTFWITLGWSKPQSDVQFHRGVPLLLGSAIAVVLFGTPILIKKIYVNDIGMSEWGAGAFYVAFVLVTHAIHSVIQPSMRKRSPLTIVAGVLVIFGGAYCALAAVGPASLRMATIGLVLLMAGLFAVGRGFGMSVSGDQVRGYATAFALLIAYLAGTVLLFLLALSAELVTIVEMTGEYWVVLILATTVMSFVVLFARQMPKVQQALLFWFRLTRSKPLFYTPMASLLVAGFTGVASWVGFVAPALYDGDKGAATFARQAEEVNAPATARFVAALTNLGTPGCKNGDCPEKAGRFAPGDYYAMMRGDGNESDAKLKTFPRLLVYEPKEGNEFLNAVSASGSPFPIYPGRQLSRPIDPLDPASQQKIGLFIDGGYSHLVPVEGAVKLGAKQVLIVANKAHEEPEETSRLQDIWSLLVSDLSRTAAFLFDRAQVVDHLSQNDVMVATIAPTASGACAAAAAEAAGAAPFLMDFRPRTISNLVCKAHTDVTTQRPGRVTSWGQPTVFLVSAVHEHSE